MHNLTKYREFVWRIAGPTVATAPCLSAGSFCTLGANSRFQVPKQWFGASE
jgi:hypothetical protein